MRLHGPKAEIHQRVNWVLVHDGKRLGSLADAGRFPGIVPVMSTNPLRLVRDLKLKVLLNGENVPEQAGMVELSLCPPGGLAISDPFGSKTKPTVSAQIPLPKGTYRNRWVEVNLSAKAWLEAIKKAKGKEILPGTVSVSVKYQGKSGHVDLVRTELTESGPDSPSLLPNGDFESVKNSKEVAWPKGWGQPFKYRYYPGRLYYLFNTWHNSAFANRGRVQADNLQAHSGNYSLQMLVPAGDEVAVPSDPIPLNQTEPRLIEVHALVKTHQLARLHIDALDESGNRLDSFPFIHMAPLSVGTDDWRLVRQVFRPTQPVKKLQLLLCARGMNGDTLDDTGHQPQNHTVGMIWWDNVRVYEPESTAAELKARGVKPAVTKTVLASHGQIRNLNLGELRFGSNTLQVTVVNPTPQAKFSLQWDMVSPTGKAMKFVSAVQTIATGKEAKLNLTYTLTEPCPAYSEYKGKITLLRNNETVAQSDIWFAPWCVPIDLDLGGLYLRPEQKQFIRLNLGLSSSALQQAKAVKLEIVRRGTGKALKQTVLPLSTKILLHRKQKIPTDLRDDFTNLLLTDWDVSFLPLQPFANPQRNWFLRATVIGATGESLASVDSPPFCRLAHQSPQPAIKSVGIKNSMLHINGQPWMPWGAVYGHVPVYSGPADPGKYLDWHNLRSYSIYDRFTARTYTRKENDFNCMRYVAGSITPPKIMKERWQKDNLYVSSAFVVPRPAFSLQELTKMSGDEKKLNDYLNLCRTEPYIVSAAPGIEEAFGLFHEATPVQLNGLQKVVERLRQKTGKPVMVSHGGYWNRLEFEKVPFFDIYDPETEPLYPAPLHTDLQPLVQGKNKVIWLRPQMYESVPYERWRFHVFVELMRGARGWQVAHGPGDVTLFRGLHGELEFFKPIVAFGKEVPKIRTEPPMEHWSRHHNGKTYIIAATTRPLGLGKWDWQSVTGDVPFQQCRVTEDRHFFLSETNSYGADQKVDQGPALHGFHYLPNARTWPKGSKLVQWVKINKSQEPDNLVILSKTNGRWTSSVHFGNFQPASWFKNQEQIMWYLHSMYRHSYGFMGWSHSLLDKTRIYLLQESVRLGDLPEREKWVRLEVPLEKFKDAQGLMDGIAFAHSKGTVLWGPTSIVDAQGNEMRICGDSLEHPQEELQRTKIFVPGLKAGTKIRVLFEDRELTANEGFFVDDLRGEDLYQRHGGGYGIGYGNGNVAVKTYELSRK